MFSLEQVVRHVVYMIVAGLIFWLLDWAVGKIPMMAPYKEVAHTVIVVCAVLVLIGILLSLVGIPLLRW